MRVSPRLLKKETQRKHNAKRKEEKLKKAHYPSRDSGTVSQNLLSKRIHVQQWILKADNDDDDHT